MSEGGGVMADDRDRDAGGSGARRALPGEGTGMSGVEGLAEQLAVAVKALEEIVDADPVDMALDPGWPARIAEATLDALRGASIDPCDRCGQRVALRYVPEYGANFCERCAADPQAAT